MWSSSHGPHTTGAVCVARSREQVVRPATLREGFRKVAAEGWEVTDDVSIIERMGLPVKLTMGE